MTSLCQPLRLKINSGRGIRRYGVTVNCRGSRNFPCWVFCVVCWDPSRVNVARFNRAGSASPRTQKKQGGEDSQPAPPCQLPADGQA